MIIVINDTENTMPQKNWGIVGCSGVTELLTCVGRFDTGGGYRPVMIK
jgi:hypothetical protein